MNLNKILTKEQMVISRRNKYKAQKALKVQKGYSLHHKDPNLYINDIDRYIQWNIDDLEVMKKEEHVSLHWTLDEKARKKRIERMSIAHSNLKGKYSEHHRMMMSINHAGKNAKKLPWVDRVDRYFEKQREKSDIKATFILREKWRAYKKDNQTIYKQQDERLSSLYEHEISSKPENTKELEKEIKQLRRNASKNAKISFNDWLIANNIDLQKYLDEAFEKGDFKKMTKNEFLDYLKENN